MHWFSDVTSYLMDVTGYLTVTLKKFKNYVHVIGYLSDVIGYLTKNLPKTLKSCSAKVHVTSYTEAKSEK